MRGMIDTKQRLLKLIKEAEGQFLGTGKTVLDIEDYVAEYLTANGIIVPPCKIGDTAYYLTTIDTEKELNITEIFDGVVQAISFDEREIWIASQYTNGLFYYHKASDFGKTVFLTREEAEKALGERI